MRSNLANRPHRSFRPRIIGRLRASEPGPMLVLVGSIHGNEPAGYAALESVVAKLETESLLRRGDLLAVAGNLAALDAGCRFIDEDLNRHWSHARLERLGSGETPRTVEDWERKALFEVIDQGFGEARGKVVLLDLHTTSGEGKPFAVFADTLRSRDFARRFPVPAILGLEEQLDGTLADYVGLLGHVAVAFEGGQHSDPDTLENLRAVVWVALGELSMLAKGSASGDAREQLSRSTDGVPGILEVTYRHAIAIEDEFRMRPGHRSFEAVRTGQVIADDAAGEVAAPSSGFLLMPLYQKQGHEGFFIVRRVRGFWLVLSAVLRYLRLGRMAHWLPGVSRLEGEEHVLRVDRRVARWYSLEVLHLLGFRRRTEEGNILIVERRAHDLL